MPRREMISKPSLEDAIALSARLHKGQRDKAGACYVLHPLRVMLDASLETEEERITAVLHDVVEDCDITIKQLQEFGYGDEVIEALGFLTKLPEEKMNYEAFIERICSAPVLARKVKLADLRDNSDISRISQQSERDIERQKKYRRAIDTLKATQ